MGKRQTYHYLIIIIGLVCFPFIPIKSQQVNSNIVNARCTQNNTEINISKVHLFYDIYQSGLYSCDFTLEGVGSSLTEEGNAQCEFLISGLPVIEFNLFVFDISLKFSEVPDNNSSKFSFSMIPLPQDFPFVITGNFKGRLTTNESNICTFELGVDWGTIVASQKTIITFDDEHTVIDVFPVQHIFKSNSGTIQLSWEHMLVRGFSSTIKMQLRKSLETCLQVGLFYWNATLGQTISVPIQNFCPINIEVYIIFPVWIISDTKFIRLAPNQIRTLEFKINDQAILGINGSIQLWVEFNKPIIIPVRIIAEPVNTGTFPLLEIFALFSIISIVGVIFYQKEEIKSLFLKYKENFSNNSQNIKDKFTENISKNIDPSWGSIQSKWEPILPKNELQVIKILFNQGSINQKTIADKLGVSNMTMSRIISRLESKRLIVRVPLGMSNMIELKKDHLM